MRNPGDSAPRLPREGAGAKRFPSTHWSVIEKLQQGEERENALEILCQTYWRPVYSFVRSRGRSREAAEDITQAFFTRLIGKRLFELADAERGRLRSLILRDLQFFLRDDWAKTTAERRGGGATQLSIDVDSVEAALADQLSTNPEPDHVFDLEWGRSLMRSALGQLESDYQKRKRHADFEDLSHLLIPGGDTGESQDELAKRTGRTVTALRNTLSRLRSRFREKLVQQVELTVNSPEEIDEELGYLSDVFQP